MGTGAKIGVGVAVAVGVIFLIYTFYDTQYEDARLGQIIVQYDEDTNRLTVAILLTDSNGDYTRANGDVMFTVLKDGRMVYSSDVYSFETGDFISWKSGLGVKITG